MLAGPNMVDCDHDHRRINQSAQMKKCGNSNVVICKESLEISKSENFEK